MLCFPNAKINIGLNIVEKRTDGFHNIETLFYPIGLSDILEFVNNNTQTNRINISNTGIIIDDDINNNLIVKASRLILNKEQSEQLNIHLHKNIPIGAGLGGGSSDGSFMLKALNKNFNLSLTKDDLQNYSQQLGSDCAFFIDNTPSLAYEKGNKIKPINLNLKGFFLVLIVPPIHVSTKEAYSKIIPTKPKISLSELIKKPVSEWRNKIKNDFEDSIFPKYPEIKNLKNKLYDLGAAYASMSGSGSSVYGLFDNVIDVKKHFDSSYFIWQEML
ncbi:MAG: 4-(cytidine 5'-diphospho)-2-C-methyl-D-erythritol kinase [Bacteroidetes bacterium]|nr:4-(cytidine 5'-diphospho)-2-C-methyl-D-erythritol kinase [Bacteroidota bacterium]